MPYVKEEIDRTPDDVTAVEIIVTAAAFLLRLLVQLVVLRTKPSTWFYSQASELGEVAHSIAIGNGFSSPFGGSTGPSAFLPPGYPLLVGTLFKWFGSYSRGAEIALLFAQTCFGTLAVLLLMILAKRTFGRRTAVVSGILLAVNPWIVTLGLVFWDTSLSLLMLIGLVLLTICCVQRPSGTVAWMMALLGAAAIATNASLALTAIILYVWAISMKRSNDKAALAPGLLFLVLCSIWPMRNAIAMRAFIPLRDNLGYELWQGNRPDSDGFFEPQLHPNTNMTEFQQFKKLGELGYMHRKSAEAKKFIEARPARFLGLTAKRIGYFWLGIGRQHYLNQIFIAIVTTFLGVCGFFLFIRRHGWKDATPILIPIVFFPLPYYITHPDFRFWCLLSPLLTAAAVYTFTGRTREQPS